MLLPQPAQLYKGRKGDKRNLGGESSRLNSITHGGQRTFPTCDARRLSSLALASSRGSLHFPEETTLLSVTVVRLPTTVGRTRASMRSLPRSLSQSVTVSQSVLFIVLSPPRARQSSSTRFPSKPKERTHAHGRGRRATETRAEEVAARRRSRFHPRARQEVSARPQ